MWCAVVKRNRSEDEEWALKYECGEAFTCLREASTRQQQQHSKREM
jgi:hypothetical protein